MPRNQDQDSGALHHIVEILEIMDLHTIRELALTANERFTQNSNCSGPNNKSPN